MDDIEQKLREAKNKIRMNAAEKANIRSRILSYMNEHPCEKKEAVNFVPIRSWYSYFSFMGVRAVSTILLLLVLAGGVSFYTYEKTQVQYGNPGNTNENNAQDSLNGNQQDNNSSIMSAPASEGPSLKALPKDSAPRLSSPRALMAPPDASSGSGDTGASGEGTFKAQGLMMNPLSADMASSTEATSTDAAGIHATSTPPTE